MEIVTVLHHIMAIHNMAECNDAVVSLILHLEYKIIGSLLT